MDQNSSENINKFSKSIEFVIFLLFLLGPLTGNIINVLFGVLSTDFNVTPTHILTAIPAFMFPFAITQLFSGAVSDIKGRIPVLILGLTLFLMAMLIAAFSFNLEMYIIANIIGGVGFGFINPVLIALMTDITPGPNIAKKMGYLGASANLGVGLGPLIASQMILIGWQSIYVLFIILTSVCLVYFIFIKRRQKSFIKEGSFRTFLSQLSIEWRRFQVILMILSAFLISHTYIAINIWTSKSLTQTHVVNETLIGIILGLAGIGAALMGMLTGIIIKKKGMLIPILVGSLILLSSLVIFLIIGELTSQNQFSFLSIGWILIGISGGILFTSITYYSQVLSPERRGVLAGSLTASYFIGIALVPTTLAPFSDTYGIIGIYNAIMIISIIFTIITMLLYFFTKSIIRDKNENI
ncbi:MAG: MFS transporter [Promethearchaeota archaeon]